MNFRFFIVLIPLLFGLLVAAMALSTFKKALESRNVAVAQTFAQY